MLFLIKKVFFLHKSQIAHNPAHLHPELIIIITNLGHVERSILAAMRRSSFFYFLSLKTYSKRTAKQQ